MGRNHRCRGSLGNIGSRRGRLRRHRGLADAQAKRLPACVRGLVVSRRASVCGVRSPCGRGGRGSVLRESEGVEDWRVVGEGACANFRTGSFAAGARLVHAISELANLDDHHPDVDLRHDGVIVRLITVAPNYYGLSERDIELARQIAAIARKLGVPADPANVQTVQITIDAFDIPKVKAFWRAVLGYQDRDDSPEDLVDPRGRGASI